MLEYLTYCATIISYNSLFTKLCQGKIYRRICLFTFSLTISLLSLGRRGLLTSPIFQLLATENYGRF